MMERMILVPQMWLIRGGQTLLNVMQIAITKRDLDNGGVRRTSSMQQCEAKTAIYSVANSYRPLTWPK